MHIILAILLISIATTTSNIVWGPITWSNAGRSTQSYIAGGNGGVIASGSSLTLQHQYQPRVYVVNTAEANSFTEGMFQKFYLLGQSIQFTVDLSTTGCGCNAAFYLVAMPQSGSSDFYCDANDAGHYCIELDLFEANRRAFQVTAHCGSGTQACEWGCAVNSLGSYGSQYNEGGSVINTNSPFNVAISFGSSGGSFNQMNTIISQNGKSISFSICDAALLEPLTSALTNGMVLVMSYWSGDMNWLDQCSSSGNTCPTNSQVTFSNIKVAGGFSADAAEVASTNSNSGFVGSPGFYAVIGVSGLVVITLFIGLLVWRIRHGRKSEVV